jgi:hypothetical protein
MKQGEINVQLPPGRGYITDKDAVAVNTVTVDL